MTPYECYLDYLALKAHFTREDYDYFKFNGKVNAKYSSFEKRNDRYKFEKLSTKTNPHERLLASISAKPDIWIADILDNPEYYNSWKSTQKSLTYTFTSDIKNLSQDFDSNFRVIDGNHPSFLKLYLRKKITRETLLVTNRIINFIPHWKKSIKDDVVWPNIFFNLKKYSGFLEVDLEDMKKILKEEINSYK